jgi:hypothetical protein
MDLGGFPPRFPALLGPVEILPACAGLSWRNTTDTVHYTVWVLESSEVTYAAARIIPTLLSGYPDSFVRRG